MSDLTRGLKELDDARPRYHLAHKMYDGTAREIAANPTVEPALRLSGAKYRANLARKAVKSRTNRLKVAAITVAGEDKTTPLTDRLTAEVAQPNDFDVELPRFIEKVCEYGDAYLLRWPNPKAPLNADGSAAKVDVFVRDPLTMRAIYDRENEREIEFVVDSWCVGEGDDERTRVNLYYDDRVERFISISKMGEVAKWVDSLFAPYTGDASEDDDPETAHIITYDHGLPIEHGRTERPYGRPEHYDAYGPQNAITKIMATHLAGIDWNGWPYRYQLSKAGTKGANLADWGDGDNREAPGSPTGPVRPGQAPPPRRSGKVSNAPGTMNRLSNVDTVGQLDGSPAGVFLEPLVAYIRLLGETTDTPMNVTDPTGQVESGQSRMARIDDLLSRVASLKDQLAGPISGICEGALAMLGEEGATVVVTWAPSSKVSDLDGWLSIKAQQDAGVPERVTLIEAGYLPEEVDKWANELNGKLTVLEKIATVGAALGQAVQVMGLDQAMAAELLGTYIAEVLTGDSANA